VASSIAGSPRGRWEVNVTVRYSQSCGLRSRAARLATKIETELHVPVRMQPGAAGQFDVLVDDDVVATSSHPGFFRWILGDTGLPDDSATIAAIRARLAR